MPKLGAGVYHEAVILKWAKKEGDRVEAEEAIAEIETDKVVTTYQSPAGGTILKLLFDEGETVRVGTPILLLGEPGEAIPSEYSTGTVAEVTPPQSSSPLQPPPAPDVRPDVSPAARRLAENMKVDLSSVSGTGPGGSIMREDILRVAREARQQGQQQQQRQSPRSPARGDAGDTPGPVESSLIPMSTMRLTIAERLTRSQRETAHVTLTREVEVAAVVALVKDEGTSSDFGYNEVFIKAAAKALKDHPMLNSQLEGDKIRVMDAVNIGVAVAVEGGLMTPTVRGADRLSLPALAAAVRELTERARSRRLTSEEFSGATFTVSNLGAYGIEAFTPIINPPQVSILGVGRVKERPWAEDGALSVRPTVHLSLTFDHRVVDGSDAALFLDAVARHLKDPSSLRT